jgi:Domain of unknown function (DUF4326)
MPKVLNYRRDKIPPDAVNIMRGTPWGNPYKIEHHTRVGAILKFEKYVLPGLDVSSLRGKDLVCCCKPLPCHGDLILKKASA